MKSEAVEVEQEYAPCPDPRCNDTLGAMPIPQCVTAVRWAEEVDSLARENAALREALNGLSDDGEADGTPCWCNFDGGGGEVIPEGFHQDACLAARAALAANLDEKAEGNHG